MLWFGLVPVAVVVLGLASAYTGGLIALRQMRREEYSGDGRLPRYDVAVAVLIMGGLATATFGGLLVLVWLFVWLVLRLV